MKKILLSGLLLISTIVSLHAQLYSPIGTTLGTSTNNNVGIGIATPSFPLSLFGSTSSGTYAQFAHTGTGNTSNDGFIVGVGADSQGVILNRENTGIDFYTNNIKRVLIANNGYVGVGTDTPSFPLSLFGSTSSGTYAQFAHIGTGNTSNDGFIVGVGSDSQGVILNRENTGIEFYTNNIKRVLITNNGYVGIGTVNPDSRLTVNGDIHATEVKVTSSVPAPDYVFAPDYKLKSLKEVEEFINKNSHLPEIPSAKEIEKNGLFLAEMNMNLLKKVEELTLYMIEQSKEIETLKKENKSFSTLSERFSKIERQLKVTK
jgi:hypothetical protein